MWKLVVSIKGDEPTEEEVEEVENNVMKALDDAGVDYLDVTAQ